MDPKEKEQKEQKTNQEVKEITLKELNELIADGVKEIVGDLKTEILRETQKGLADLRKPTDEEKVEKAAQFLKDVCFGKLDEKAINTNPGSFGNTIPTELADIILTKKDKISRMRQLAYAFKLSGNFQLPVEGTGVIAYWVDDNANITDSNPNIDKKNLTDNYLAARVLMPRKLLNTSAFNIVNFIGELSSRKLRDAEETAFVAGDGTGKPYGIRGAGLPVITQELAAFDYPDIVNLYYELPEQYRQNAVFMTSGAGMKLIRKLTDQNKMPIFDVRDQTIFNRPVLESADIPANLGTGMNETEIMFFDPWYYWIKDGEEMFIDTDKVISKLQTEVVVAEAIDGVYTMPEAGRKLTGVK